ncbi:Sphingosine kinase 1 [Spatholobus suberectus]|nr:Sphingosine kinase 1 [Spatholobus suberectus]
MDRTDDPLAAIISDRVNVNGTVTQLSLLADGRLWWPEGSQRNLTIEKEVLGFAGDGRDIRLKTIVEIGDGCCGGGGSRGKLVRNDVVFRPSSEESHRLWCHKLREFIDSLGRPKRLFVFVNPFGGTKSATIIFRDQVKPLLEDANVQLTVQETKHQLHAKQVVQSIDLSKYDGIVCVSGDGILVEVVNGLLQRQDWNTAIKMPLGVVPAGTGNGMAKSLLDSVGDPCTVPNAVLAIIRGLVADIDIESEKYRWMGTARIDFYALTRIFRLRHYTGCLYFVPAPGFEAYGEPISYPGSSTSKGSNSDLIDEEPVKLQRLGYQGSEIDLENLGWRVLHGPFISVWLHNVPWGGENTKAAPDAKFSDGYLDLILVKNCPKLPLLSMMSSLDYGGHVKSPYVMYLKVKVLVLEPGPRLGEQQEEGIIDVDGEVLARGKGSYQCEQKALMAYDKLQITVDQGLATIFTPM